MLKSSNPQLARFDVAQSHSRFARVEWSRRRGYTPSASLQPHQHHYVHAAIAVSADWRSAGEPSGSCVYRVVGGSPDTIMLGAATLGDMSILPQELPLFDTLESLFICAHFMS